jgi:CRP/FNR family transcriptional regulator, anaerobic regulatory protein
MTIEQITIHQLRKSCSQCSLQALCLPATIGLEDIDRLDQIVKNRRPLKRGESLFRSGQSLGSLFVAREGAFKTTMTDEDGAHQVIGFQLPGELMGLDALGTGTHTCESVALTQATVCEVPLDKLESVAAQVPGLQRQLLRIIGQSIGREHSHLEILNRRSATDRIALFLHGLSERYLALGRSADVFMLPMSREDIGSYLGLVIETVSRTLSKMQDDGLIEVNGRQLRILQPTKIDAMVHSNSVGRG